MIKSDHNTYQLPRAVWRPKRRAAVVAFLHQKGGVGKSTLSLLTALTLEQAKTKVLLVDADPQATSSDWFSLHGVPSGLQLEMSLKKQVATRTDVDWVVIDAPPGLSNITESIVQIADLLLIPCRPALPDVWTLTWLAALIQRKAKAKPSRACVTQVVFNQVEAAHSADFLRTRQDLCQHVRRKQLDINAVVLPLDVKINDFFAEGKIPQNWSSLLLQLLEAEPSTIVMDRSTGASSSQEL